MLNQSPNTRSPFQGILGLIIGIVALVLVFRVAGIIYSFLWSYVAPAAFIGALIIDHKVFVNYANNVFGLLKKNWLYGLGAVALSVVFFPFVAFYLLGTALYKKKLKEQKEAKDLAENGELIDYEIIDSEPLDLDSQLPPPPPEPEKRTRPGSEYDNMF